MRVLLTGATGLIGKEVGKRLVQAGHQLVVVTRNQEKARLELPFPAELHEWNGRDQFPQSALVDVDAVIHLSGESVANGRWTEERKKKIFDSRVHATRSIVDAIRKARAPIKVWIQGSAIGFYGSRGDEILEENSKPGEDFLASVVQAWESEADTVSTVTPGVRIAKIRTGVVFSRSGGALEKMLPLFARGLGGRISNGQQWMSWIHLEDISRLFVFALENQAISGVINGVAPEPVRNERFTIEFARALKRSVFLPVPEMALKLALGEMAQMVLASQRVLSKRLQEAGFKFQFPEFVNAIHDIGSVFQCGQHELLTEQWLPRPPSEVFPFFASELNLEKLTPAFLGFRVLRKTTPVIREGTIIDYRLSLHGVPVKWRTRIESWVPNQEFVDIQLSGPYSKWQHTHQFVAMAGGTLVRDHVLYKIPLGIIGDIGASWKVEHEVAEIFNFRRLKIDELFSTRAQ